MKREELEQEADDLRWRLDARSYALSVHQGEITDEEGVRQRMYADRKRLDQINAMLAALDDGEGA